MKRTLPKAGVFSRLVIAACLSLMAACSPERAEPEPPLETDDTPGAETTDAPSDELAGDSAAAADEVDETTPTPPAAMGLDRPLEELTLTEGQWFMKEGEALFGPPESEATFTIGCDRGSGEFIMTRSFDIGARDEVQLGLHAGGASAIDTWRDAGDVMPIGMARMDAGNDIFADMEVSDRFAVAAEGERLLVLPVTDGVRGLIASCR
ncbi:hypothetical protein [Henriciella marina]|uniref:hypothetical protein n=1 Tax=Henriciella marina TaxID=453851 RepID=UPI0012EA006E|nr:hypothetical protein [Henriciella marina]